jgi:two-component system sensor histidine kinase ChvG
VRAPKSTDPVDAVSQKQGASPASDNPDDHDTRQQQSLLALNRSPLARKIITFNVVGLLILVSGILYFNPFRDTLRLQRGQSLRAEAQLIASILEGTTSDTARNTVMTAQPPDFDAILKELKLAGDLDVWVFGDNRTLLANRTIPPVQNAQFTDRTPIIDLFTDAWTTLTGLWPTDAPKNLPPPAVRTVPQSLLDGAFNGVTTASTSRDAAGQSIFAVASPVRQNGQTIAIVALTSGTSDIDMLVRLETEKILQMLIVAILISIGLSFVLAATIASPLSVLARAAEIGRETTTGQQSNPARVRIPDLSSRTDEVGRLSAALRGMVTALYDRIDANEQFAADVAHEIKNPLASLRSAITTLRNANRPEQRVKLMDIIDHDVRRLDRLVSDISNASRLDSELVKDDEERFDLLHMIGNLTSYLSESAYEKSVEFITDLPADKIEVYGLEERLAQVFVNLITNAISFCEPGDAVRVWVRRRDNRVLVVVEDTGPGIPMQALQKVFDRFYSERPESQFGDHSGLGLAISKQIVDAHDGVIWAENIRPTDFDANSEPLGARFVVGLPV